jgi:ATP phosphoribosyltransferase
MEKLRIAIQKDGRLTKPSLEFLKELGIDLVPNGRQLIMKSEKYPIEVLLLRDDDIPTFVQQSAANLGLVGLNELVEQGYELNIIKKFEFAKCRLVIAVPIGSSIKKISDLMGERIATSYPNILGKFLKNQNIVASIIKISGSVESAPELGVADAIFDITQSGRTLKENGLEVLCEVFKSQAVLIGSPYNGFSTDQFLDNLLDA